MTRVLAISPHLDDAVFSAGGTLFEHAAAGDTVTVLTCFTGNVPQPNGFALACQLDKGLPADVDYMALRRAEDRAACSAIGAEVIHLRLLEAPHRGYGNAAALFGRRLPGDDIADTLVRQLREHVDQFEPDVLYGPFGIGNHVDHRIVRDAIEQVTDSRAVTWWEDYPYAMRGSEPSKAFCRRALSAQGLAAKIEAALCYASQLTFQFGGPSAARAAMTDWAFEGFAS